MCFCRMFELRDLSSRSFTSGPIPNRDYLIPDTFLIGKSVEVGDEMYTKLQSGSEDESDK